MPLVDPGRFAAIFVALWAAHAIGDHIVQTDHQAATKATSWWGMAGHIAGYQATQAVAVAGVAAATGVRPGRWQTLAGMALSAVTHAFLDRRWPVVELLARTGSPSFASSNAVRPARVYEVTPGEWVADGQPLPIHGPYLADQALHTGCLALAAALIAWRSTR